MNVPGRLGSSPYSFVTTPAQDRLLAILRLDMAAVLRGYFPADEARELSRDCEALVRTHLKAGAVMRRVAFTPAAYTRPVPKSEK